jgi:hypothetical protein
MEKMIFTCSIKGQSWDFKRMISILDEGWEYKLIEFNRKLYYHEGHVTPVEDYVQKAYEDHWDHILLGDST